MIRFFTTALVAVFFSLSAVAQTSPNYNIEIPDSLLENANSVILFYHTQYIRTSAENYSQNVHLAVRILNEQGKQDARLLLHYDRNSKISKIRGYYYQDGQKPKKIKSGEIKDYASHADYTLFSDSRVKTVLPLMQYPFTVEYEYTIDYNGIVAFERWEPCGNGILVREADLSFITPTEFTLKHMELNYPFVCDSFTDAGKTHYKWSAKNIKALKPENNEPNYLDYIPAVFVAPTEIVFEKTRGDFSTWQTYGLWTNGLIEGRDVLPQNTVDFVQNLAAKYPSKREKVRAIYQYMQSRTRYVNIALGIGGFQPISATDVDATGYGDCKALSNYTKSLLKCAGIEAFYAEIGSGDYQEIKYPKFASADQTNHIIVCVPDAQDTIWLECTSQKIPMGYIGDNNMNRYALLIKPEGGVLVRTPNYSSEQNTKLVQTKLSVQEDGSAKFTFQGNYQNFMFEEVFPLYYYSPDDQKKMLLKKLSSKSFTIDNFSLTDASDSAAKAQLVVNGKLAQIATKSGNRLFVTPTYLSESDNFDKIQAKRTKNVFQSMAYSSSDKLDIEIPANYAIESLPQDTEVKSVFGSYALYATRVGNNIRIERKITTHAGSFAPTLFAAINDYKQQVQLANSQKIILKRTDQ